MLRSSLTLPNFRRISTRTYPSLPSSSFSLCCERANLPFTRLSRQFQITTCFRASPPSLPLVLSFSSSTSYPSTPTTRWFTSSPNQTTYQASGTTKQSAAEDLKSGSETVNEKDKEVQQTKAEQLLSVTKSRLNLPAGEEGDPSSKAVGAAIFGKIEIKPP